MAAIAHHHVMLDHGRGIDDRVAADSRTRVDDGVRQDDRARSDPRARRDPRGGMDQRGPPRRVAEPIRDRDPRREIRGGRSPAETQHEPRRVAGGRLGEARREHRVVTKPRDIEDAIVAVRGCVPLDDPAPRHAPCSVGHDASVLATAEHDQPRGDGSGTTIGGLRGGLGGRHAAMISAMRCPA